VLSPRDTSIRFAEIRVGIGKEVDIRLSLVQLCVNRRNFLNQVVLFPGEFTP
jgi:hypothetical protein